MGISSRIPICWSAANPMKRLSIEVEASCGERAVEIGPWTANRCSVHGPIGPLGPARGAVHQDRDRIRRPLFMAFRPETMSGEKSAATCLVPLGYPAHESKRRCAAYKQIGRSALPRRAPPLPLSLPRRGSLSVRSPRGQTRRNQHERQFLPIQCGGVPICIESYAMLHLPV